MNYKLKPYKSGITKEDVKKLSENETKEQRKETMISNIYGLMDSDSTVTKEEIRKELENFY